MFAHIFYCNTSIYKKDTPLTSPNWRELLYHRMSFHFRHRAEAVLRRAADLSKAFSTARLSTPKKDFIRGVESC